MPEISRDDMKAAVKEAIKEWLDVQFAKFGRWSFYGICSLGLVGMLYLWMLSEGWRR